jgi:hypothetical protein
MGEITNCVLSVTSAAWPSNLYFHNIKDFHCTDPSCKWQISYLVFLRETEIGKEKPCVALCRTQEMRWEVFYTIQKGLSQALK